MVDHPSLLSGKRRSAWNRVRKKSNSKQNKVLEYRRQKFEEKKSQ